MYRPDPFKEKGKRPMKRILAIVLAAIILLLSACTSGLDRKLDGSSEKSFESSLEAMKKSAKPDEIARLDDALLVLAITDVSIGYEGGIIGALQKISTRSPEQLTEQLMPLVHGRTGREVIAAGQKRKKDEAGRQLANVDRETAQLMVRAALTGHLVFSSLHTNDAPGAIHRLVDLGVESYLIAPTLAGVVGQRLVRQLCPDCRRPIADPEEVLKKFRLKPVGELPPQLWEPGGCEKCRETEDEERQRDPAPHARPEPGDDDDLLLQPRPRRGPPRGRRGRA